MRAGAVESSLGNWCGCDSDGIEEVGMRVVGMCIMVGGEESGQNVEICRGGVR